ncbi:MAG: hypothetical protein RLW62_19690 [Gammaproteobacteria bacterium]
MSTPIELSRFRNRDDGEQGLAHLVDAYTTELAERRAALLADRAEYSAKLAGLARLDPHDFSGLARLYRQHVEHIDGLLSTFEAAA